MSSLTRVFIWIEFVFEDKNYTEPRQNKIDVVISNPVPSILDRFLADRQLVFYCDPIIDKEST